MPRGIYPRKGKPAQSKEEPKITITATTELRLDKIEIPGFPPFELGRGT